MHSGPWDKLEWAQGVGVGGFKLGFALTADVPFAKVLGKGLPQTDIS